MPSAGTVRNADVILSMMDFLINGPIGVLNDPASDDPRSDPNASDGIHTYAK